MTEKTAGCASSFDRSYFSFLSLALAVLLFYPLATRAQAPARPSVAEIRELLRQQQAERDDLARRQALIPWRQLADSPDQVAGDKVVLVRLSNAMNLYRAVFTFTPGPGAEAAAVRVPLCWRGEQWIALPPGAWQATVAVGRAAGARAFRIPLAPLQGRHGEVYELALTGQTERAVSDMEQAALKQAADKALHLQEPVKKE